MASSALLDTGRLTALTDGVIAIAMTPLVLNVVDAAISVPVGQPVLPVVVPQLASYALSFVILGLLWNGHHVAFHYVEHADRGLLWRNIVFLLFAALVPFPAEMIARWPIAFGAVAAYGGVLTCAALSLLAVWVHAAARGLTAADLPPAVARAIPRRIVSAVLLYGGGVAVAWWSPVGGVAVLAASHLFFVARPVTEAEMP